MVQKGYAAAMFFLNHYGKNEFYTKQLERDYGNTAYATIRTSVQKSAERGCSDAKNTPADLNTEFGIM